MYERDEFWEDGASLLLPPQSSTTAGEVDGLFWFITWSSVVTLALVTFGIVYLAYKYRRRSHADRPPQVHENKWIEASWVVIPTIMTLIVFFWGFRSYIGTYVAPADSIEINVKGQKWFWTFEYANGIETTNEIVVPEGQPVRLVMTSQDVLHSFFVPEFRIKHDVLPNRYTYVWFEAPRQGVYQVLCTEYCGTNHSNMGAVIRVVGRGEYEEFLRRQGGDAERLGVTDSNLPPAQRGQEAYTRRQCNTCHSVDGAANTGPTWLGSWGQPRPGSTQGAVDEAYVLEAIVEPGAYIVPGYQNQMPDAYDGLSEQELRGLAAYIRLINGAATPADTTLAPADSSAQQPIVAPADQSGDPSRPVGFGAQN